MYMRELDALIAVADRGSFLRASEVLFVTPASVMHQVNKLETMAGVKLVNRTNQGTSLTDAGRSLYNDAKRMIELSDQAIRKARALGAVGQNVVRIGTSILRPCGPLIDLWDKADDGTLPLRIQIVPFEDDPTGLGSVFTRADCFIGPCDSAAWQKEHSVLVLRRIPCRIAVPRKHRLAHKKSLSWKDLDGETCLIVRRGQSEVLNEIRDDILEHHPDVRIRDVENFYDTSTFNECESSGCIMESLDIWSDVHPGLVTLPMEWDYTLPYGIVFARNASEAVQDFIHRIRDSLDRESCPSEQQERMPT